MSEFIIFDHVNFAYSLPAGAKIPALNDISFTINKGEYVSVIGANGSGKTTAAKLMNGLIHPDSGRVLVNGIDTRIHASSRDIFRQVGLIFQNPHDQIVASQVEEDTAFGPENLALPRAEISARVEEGLRLSGATHLRQRQTYLLSAGETQRIALAGVLALHPECLIFDETTAMLDPRSRREILSLIIDLHNKGYTIVHITHDLDETLLAERILVFQEGQLVMDDLPRSVYQDRSRLQALGLDIPHLLQFARDLQPYFANLQSFYRTPQVFLTDLAGSGSEQRNSLPAATRSFTHDGVIMFQHVSHMYLQGTPLAQPALQDVSFTIFQGVATGLVGHTGSGKSTVLQHMNGLLRPQQGRVAVTGFDLTQPTLDVRALRRQVGLVFQNPEAQFFERYVGDEIAYAARTLGYQGKLRALVQHAMQLVGLDFEQFVDRPLQSLSGGQKRRVALASYLVVQPHILLLDEPFVGLDPQAHQQLSHFVRQLKSDGITIILSTHSMHDLLEITDQVLVLRERHLVFNGGIAQLFNALKLKEWDLEIPLEVMIANAMRQNGIPVPYDCLRWKTMLTWLHDYEEGGHVIL